MAIVINGVDVPRNCANCERKAACKQRIYLEGRPDGCPIMAMPENCLECLRTHFRSGIKCGEWAKLMAILNGALNADTTAERTNARRRQLI